MLSAALPGHLALAGRIFGLGVERPLIKALGQNRNSIAATTLYFGIGELLLVPLVAWQWLHDPLYVAQLDKWILQALATAVIYAVAFHVYVYAMGVGEVSYLSPLYATAFIWLYLLDVSFGHARLGLQPAAGVMAVTLGIVFLTPPVRHSALARLSPLRVLRQPGACGMLIYAFCLATARLIDKSAAPYAPPVLYALANNSLSVLGGLAILALRGRSAHLGQLVRERLWIALPGAVAGMGAYVLLLFALDYFNPSVVEPVTQLSVFIAIGLGGLWFHERVRARWLPAALVVCGAALLMLGR